MTKQNDKLKDKPVKKNKSFFKLLIKNNLKTISKTKVQLVGLILLTVLLTIVLSIFSATSVRINGSLDYLNEASNIHDVMVDYYNTNLDDEPVPIDGLPSSDYDLSFNQQQILLNEEDELGFTFDRLESRVFAMNDREKVFKTFAYSPSQQVDKMLVTDGHGFYFDENDDSIEKYQIVLNKEFAQFNDIEIGDVIRLVPDEISSDFKVDSPNFDNYDEFLQWKDTSEYNNYNVFMVTGYGISADMSTPIIDNSTVIPDKRNECVAYVPSSDFGLTKEKGIWNYNINDDILAATSSANTEVSYALDFHKQDYQNDLLTLNNDLKNYFSNIDNADADMAFNADDSQYRFSSRITTINSTMSTFVFALLAFLISVGIIAIFALIIVMRKRVQKQSKQLGVLKSLGVSNRALTTPFVIYPIFISLISGLLGYVIGSILQLPLIYAFSNYFNLDYGSYYFDIWSFLIDIFGFFIILYIFVIMTVVFYLRKDVIKMIKTSDITSFGSFPQKIKGLFAKTNFGIRFRASVFASSIGKMSAVSVTLLLGTILMSFAVIAPKILNDNSVMSYNGVNYDNLVQYNSPTWNLPTTYYQTYDPDVKIDKSDSDAWNDNLNRQKNNEILNELTSGEISPEYYAPNSSNPGLTNTISNLQGRIMTKDFLDSLDQKDDPGFIAYMTVTMAWPDYSQFNIQLNDKLGLTTPSFTPYSRQSWIQKINNLQDDGQIDDVYSMFRSFYIKYRNTVSMSVNPKLLNNSEVDYKSTNINQDDLKWDKIAKDSYSDDLQFDIEDHHLDEADDQQIIKNKSLTPDKEKELSIKMMAWYMYTFDLRSGVGILQGTYSRSPYFVQQNIVSAFNDDSKQFNVGFGVNPYNPNTDYIGTMLNANYHDLDLNVYGVDSDFDMISLTDSNSNNLLNRLDLDDPNAVNSTVYPIVINQSMAKKFGLSIGSELDLNYVIKNALDSGSDIKPSDFDASDCNKDNYAKKYLNQNFNYNNYSYKDKAIYTAGALGTEPTKAQDYIHNNTWKIDNEKLNQKFQVVGIANFYGEPSAYINNDVANHLSKYDDSESQEALYQIFRTQFDNGNYSDWTDYDITDSNKQAMSTIQNNTTLEELKKAAPNDENAKLALQMFNNAFPIYNYKMSKSSDLVDMTDGISTASPFGDDSATGLNGYFDDENNYISGYGMSSYTTAIPVYGEKFILDQITALINIVLFVFGLFALFISIIIIMLSTNLIISENKRQIISLKVLGYKNTEIANILTGVYPPLMFIMFLIGFPISWFLIKLLVNQLAISSSFILPLFFSWWLPVIVLLIISSIFIFTLLFSTFDLSKANVTQYLSFDN